MLNNEKIGTFIADKRKSLGITQEQLANRLHVSFQAVSKWENGISLPSVELLFELAGLLGVSTDDLLNGRETRIVHSYRKAGVDLAYTNLMKEEMKEILHHNDAHILNGIGPFASLYDLSFSEVLNPVLVLKAETPGSKFKLAMEYGYLDSICHDLVNHLVNDIAVMGATPLAVLDTILCGCAQKETIHTFIKGMQEACHLNNCSLIGGETSIQPQVFDSKTYVLSASIAGIVPKDQLIDGTAIKEADVVLAVASNGLHTNGYSLVRMLLAQYPKLASTKMEESTFIQQVMKPHTAYYPLLKKLMANHPIHGMAHITGGGILANISRIIPESCSVHLDLNCVQTLDIFRILKEWGSISDEEMLATFNCGVGLVLIVPSERKEAIMQEVNATFPCYEIGFVEKGSQKCICTNNIQW